MAPIQINNCPRYFKELLQRRPTTRETQALDMSADHVYLLFGGASATQHQYAFLSTTECLRRRDTSAYVLEYAIWLLLLFTIVVAASLACRGGVRKRRMQNGESVKKTGLAYEA